MMQSFEDTNKLGKEYIDSGLQSAAALSKGFQAIAVETTEFSKKSFETATAAIEKLAAAKSLDTAIEVQSDYAKQAYETFVAEATKLSDLYADLAKNAYKPFESVVSKTV
ncbi:MAG: phasin family protein [Nitratireductor sp.]